MHPYQPPVPYTQRRTWSNLSKLKPRFAQFIDILRRIYVNVPFLETLKEALTYLKFLKELLSKQGKREVGITEPLMEELCRAVLQSKSLSTRQDLGSFILCALGDLQIGGVLCDLEASMSLMSFSLCRKLHF